MEFTLGDKKSLEYFHQFSITDKTLQKFRVYPAKTVYINKKACYKSTKDNPTFVYLHDSGHVKTYKPLTDKREDKWGGNSDREDVFGLGHLPRRGRILFVTSSLKDLMVLYEMGFNAIAFNGEGYGLGKGETARFVEKLFNKLDKRFENIVFYLDNDTPGLEYSQKLAQQYKKKYVTNPPNTPKDISDYVKQKSFYNGKRRIKRLLSKLFRVQSGFLEFVESLDNSTHGSGNPFGDSHEGVLHNKQEGKGVTE